MTLEGFIIGMIFLCLAFVSVWALGNVGLDNHKKDKSALDDESKHHPKPHN
jgi:hypothetical protein